MESKFDLIDENLKRINFNLKEALERYRKADEKVRLMAETKTVAPEMINYALYREQYEKSELIIAVASVGLLVFVALMNVFLVL